MSAYSFKSNGITLSELEKQSMKTLHSLNAQVSRQTKSTG